MRRRSSRRILAPIAAVAFLSSACSGLIGDPSKPSGNNDPNDPTNPNNPNNPNNPGKCTEKGPPVTPRLNRLTFAQYDRAVSELLGVERTPSTQLGPQIDGVPPVLWSGVQ